MTMAFQITNEDISNVLVSYQVSLSEDKISALFDSIDSNAVESAALSVDYDMNDDDEEILSKQTEAAYDEIAKQLFQAGVISEKNVRKFGNIHILK